MGSLLSNRNVKAKGKAANIIQTIVQEMIQDSIMPRFKTELKI